MTLRRGGVGIGLAVVSPPQAVASGSLARPPRFETFYKEGSRVDPADALERCFSEPEPIHDESDEEREFRAELEQLFEPLAREIAEEAWGKDQALPDRELVAVEGFESCPRCWAGDEDCDACDGTGIMRFG